MRSRITTPILALAVATVLTVALSSCSDDKSDGSKESTTTVASGQALTGGQICSRLSPDEITDALGLTVSDSAPVASGAPGCSYTYGVAGSTTPAAIVVSAPRSKEELGGTTGSEAFDYYVEVNKALAKGQKFEEQAVEAGDQAVRFTGTTANVGIVQAGDQVYTVTVPLDAAKPAQVDALLVAIGNAFG